MGVVDRFEKAVSQGVNAPFSKMFASSIKAVDIKTAIRESMDNSRATLNDGRVVVPNEYQVLLNQKDFQSVTDANSQVLAEELAQDATMYATEQSYVFVGPVEVAFSTGDQPLGELQIDNAIRRGPAAPVTTASASPSHPIIDIEGQQWLLTEPVTVIGGVSRRHLELRITPQGVIATDLGSTNGSYVEGHRISAATLLDGNEITIGRTHLLFWTSSVDEY